MSRVLSLVLLSACGEPPLVAPDSQPVDASARRPAPAVAPAPAPVAQKAGTPGGRVEQTMDSGGYTYALLGGCGTPTWVAGPQTALAVGDSIGIEGMMRMDGFHSPKLDRTFDSILFTRAMTVTSEPVDCSQLASGADVPADPHAGSADPHATPADPHAAVAAPQATGGAREGRVLETMESGGYRYARVDFRGTESWVAGPAVPLEVGQTVSAATGMTMHDFHSSTLDRTFAAIDFVGGLSVGSGEPRCN
ncbi:MAG: hypothetical protein KC656_22500 [Myxococcales bacterium]|nr:hypothetical protein [Myxococcales bacterium]